MKLTQFEMKFLRDYVAEESNGSIQENYSGRNMYGQKCFGYTTCESPLKSFGWLIKSIPDDCPNLAENLLLVDVQTDSMGKYDTIIYFPGIEWDHEAEGLD